MGPLADVKVTIDNGPTMPGVLTIERETITNQMLREVSPDWSWTHVDTVGHWHAYEQQDGGLPTLDARDEHVECNGGCGSDGCEGYDRRVYLCVICGEEVEPGVTVVSPGPVREIPGRELWRVEVESDGPVEGRVTVRVEVDGMVYFGVAEAKSRMQSPAAFGMARTFTVLHGVGPLGRRKAVAG